MAAKELQKLLLYVAAFFAILSAALIFFLWQQPTALPTDTAPITPYQLDWQNLFH